MARWFKVLGHCTLLFGLACVEPSWSQSDRSPRAEISRTSITTGHQTAEHQTTDRNWHAFWRHHLGRWDGSWTRYNSSGIVKETFASTREFTANSGKTAIVQSNRYRYADGRSIEKEWSYNITDHSHQDGFAHPASRPMRGLALNNGAAAWLIPSLEPQQYAPFELFLVDGDRRHSVGVVYGPTGDLLRTATIREQRGETSDRGWSDAILQVEPWHPIGLWRGQEQQIRRNLSLVPMQNASWQWGDEDPDNPSFHYFPDGIILSCPERLTPGRAFSIQVIWMLKDDAMQTITAQYDKNAVLIGVTHQALKPVVDPR